MLETLKLGAQAFLLLAIALIADLWAVSGTVSGALALLAGLLAGLLIVLIWLVGYSCRHDRQRLAELFGGSVWLLLVLVTAFVFLQGCIIILVAIRVFQAGITNARVIVELGLGALVAFVSADAIGKSVGTIAQKLITGALGIVVTPDGQPALWNFVHTIAAKLGAVPPKQIIVGLDPTFYATAADIELVGPIKPGDATATVPAWAKAANNRISGETMYLSLPLMRVLSKPELATVIGHELGHFKGLDTVYTLEFVPVYRGVIHALNVTSALSGESLYGRVITSPASTILRFYLSEFVKAERQISRDRELEADKAGVSASSPEALVGALVKVAAYTPIWPQLCRHAATIVKEGKIYSNMSMAFCRPCHSRTGQSRPERA